MATIRSQMTNEELVALIQAGERDRMPELWEQVEHFVANRANRLLIRSQGGLIGVDFDDLYNSGYIALCAAVDSYDPAAGMQFIGWLAFHLQHAFAETGGYRSKGAENDPARHAVSLDAPLGGDGEDRALGEVIEDPSALQELQGVEDRIWYEQLHAAMERALNQLPEGEKAAVKARYYEGQRCNPLLVDRAITKLRRPAVSRELEQFIEQRTPYYLHVGVAAFQSTWESAVERIVTMRERMERSRA